MTEVVVVELSSGEVIDTILVEVDKSFGKLSIHFVPSQVICCDKEFPPAEVYCIHAVSPSDHGLFKMFKTGSVLVDVDVFDKSVG